MEERARKVAESGLETEDPVRLQEGLPDSEDVR